MNRPIKLAYCIDDLYSAGGMQRVLTLKVNYLADVLGYDITIFLTEEKGLPFFYPLSSRVQVVNFDINFYRMYQQTSFWVRLFKYVQYARAHKHALTQALMTLKPDITVSMLRRDINFINSIGDGSRKVGEIHFDKSNYRIFNGPLPACIRNKISKFWMKQLIGKLRQLDRFVVLTQEDLQQWTELKEVICIYNPVSFKEVAHYSTCENKKVIVAGRYTYQKGFDLLLPAWKIVAEQHPDWTLHVYGGGDRTVYQQQAEELGITSTCTLHPQTSEIAERMIESSLLVLPSRYEGFGLVLTEAMACGVPVVSFACPCGPRDIIADGTDGLWVESGNIEQLAEKIGYLMENEELRKKMGIAGRENVKRFDIENIMPQWDKLFKSLLP